MKIIKSIPFVGCFMFLALMISCNNYTRSNSTNTNPKISTELTAEIENTNKQLPIKLDQQTVLEDVYIEGYFVVYEYKAACAKDQIDEDILKKQIQNNIETQLARDSAFQNFITMVLNNGLGLSYKYRCSQSHDDLIIKFPYTALRNMSPRRWVSE